MSVAYNTPVQFLPGIGRRTAKVLHDLGIHTAGQFNNMPEPVLTELFGPSIRSVLRMINPITHKNVQQIFETRPSTKTETAHKKGFVHRMRLAAQLASVI